MRATDQLLGQRLASRYAMAGPRQDVDFAAFVQECQPIEADQLAELVEKDGRMRLDRNQPVELDRYLNAIPNLLDNAEALDAAIDVTLRWMSGSARPDQQSIAELIRQYPQLRDTILDAATLNNHLLSTAGVNDCVARTTERELPQDFGPPIEDGVPRYELTELLGTGAFGEVFKAVDRKLSEAGHPAMVAVKLLSQRKDGSGDLGQRLLGQPQLVEEATKARRVNHPNVVRVLDRGISNEQQAYIVYELIDGGNLHEWLVRRNELIPIREAASMVAQIARGVQAAHSAGLVHCDLKPGNIILTGDGQPKVADFGIAIRFGQPRSLGNGSDDEQHPIGNLAFISPEQYRMDDGALTVPSDVYALGGILFSMLTGKMPNGSTLQEIARTHDREHGRMHAPSPRAKRKEIDRDLDAICRRAMAVKREDRYSSAGSLADDLDAWLKHEPLQWTDPSALHVINLWRKRRPATAVSLALLLFSIVVGSLAAHYYAGRAADAELARTQAEADREIARVEAELAMVREQEVSERNISARSAMLEVRRRITEQASQGRAVSQMLPLLWNLEFLFEPELFAAADTAEHLHESRLTVVQEMVNKAVAEGRDTDLETLLWKNTLAFWYVAAGDVSRAKPMLERLDVHWRERLHPEDRWLALLDALRACAIVKSAGAIASEHGGDADMARIEAAAGLIRDAEMILRADDAASPLHILMIECLAVAYRPDMLDDPEIHLQAEGMLERLGDRRNFPRSRR